MATRERNARKNNPALSELEDEADSNGSDES